MLQTLVLTISGEQADQIGARRTRVFNGRDGSIGRSEDCDWSLPSSGVSRVHAMVRCVNEMYFIEDRSTNGMLLNGTALVKGEPAALKDGDRLQIDTFEISVEFEADNETVVQPHRSAAPSGSVSGPMPGAAPSDASSVPPASTPAPAPPPPAASSLDLDMSDLGLGPARHDDGDSDSLIPQSNRSAPASDLDPLSFLDDAGAAGGSDAASTAPEQSWNHSSGTQDHFRAPAAGQGKPVLPENWDLDDIAPPATGAPPPVSPPPPASPPPPPAPQSTAGGAVRSTPAPQGGADIDRVLHIVAEGVMEVLRARAEIKNTFRLPVTIIQRSENNPLKFAPTPEDALEKILGTPGPSYLSGADAFDDAFDDIRCHQMAMLAGVRAGFDASLRHFNPDRFEQESDARRSAFGGKGRFWERYREQYENMMRDPDDCFGRLFGEEFARAYEEQLARLKSARRAKRSRGGD